MQKRQKITIYEGTHWKDERGILTFFNSFQFKNIKRFYQVENSPKNPIRAFHGHFVEEKYVYLVTGKILLCAVPLDKPENPSKKSKVFQYLLSDENPKIVHIPAGYANGFKLLERKSRVIFFSTTTLEESQQDDFRFPYDYWGKSAWDYEQL